MRSAASIVLRLENFLLQSRRLVQVFMRSDLRLERYNR